METRTGKKKGGDEVTGTTTGTGTTTTTSLFKLTPYGKVLDLESDKDTKLFKSACDPFETTFNGEIKNVSSFIDKVKNRAKHIQCYAIFNIRTPSGDTLSLFEKWSTITKGEVRAAAATRWGTNNWEKQASYIMGKAILESLNEDFRARVIQGAKDYEMIEGGAKYNDGPCILKRIFDLVFIQTDDEGFTIRDQILNMKLSDYDYNVVDYNSGMKDLMAHLNSTQDEMSGRAVKHSLIEAYSNAKNDAFKRFIEQMVNLGSIPDVQDLMAKAERKYKQLVNKGTWDEISKEEQILALKVENEKLKKEKKSTKKRSKKEKKNPKKEKKSRQYLDREDMSWTRKAPKPNDPQTVTKLGKEWAWCKFHKKWVVKFTERFGDHTSETCLLNPKNKNKKGKRGNKKRVEVDAHAVQNDDDGVPTNSDSSDDVPSEDESSGDES